MWTLQIVTKSEFNVKILPQQIIAWTQNLEKKYTCVKVYLVATYTLFTGLF